MQQKNTFRAPTEEELKQHKKDLPNTIKRLRQEHGKTMLKVRKRYGQNPEVIFNDRGN